MASSLKKGIETNVKNAIEAKYAIARQTKEERAPNPKLEKHMREIEKHSKKVIAQKVAEAKERVRQRQAEREEATRVEQRMKQARAEAERRAAAARPKQVPVGLATNPGKVKTSATLRKATKKLQAEEDSVTSSDSAEAAHEILAGSLLPALAELSVAGLRAPLSVPQAASTKPNMRKPRKTDGAPHISTPKDQSSGRNAGSMSLQHTTKLAAE